MDYYEMETMSRRKLNVLALVFSIDTLFRAAWRRKGNGVLGLVCYPWRMFKYLTLVLLGFFLISWRVQIFLSVYAWIRRVDDVMDGDAKPPKGYTRESYLAQKQKVTDSFPSLGSCCESLQTEDLLLVHLLRESQHFGIDVVLEVINLWSVMHWDSERRHRNALTTKEEMVYYATLQDESILGFCVKVFGGDVQRLHDVSSVLEGIFTRTDWLFDLNDDLRIGIVNIPQEAVRENGFELARLLACKDWRDICAIPNFVTWYVKEIGSLEHQWMTLRATLGQNFGGVFSSRLVAFVFQRLIVKGFEQAFKESSSRAVM